MRIPSELWVKAYLRRCGAETVPAQVVRRGDPDAGVVWIKVARLDGTAALYGPAPAPLSGPAHPQAWTEYLRAGTGEAEVDAHIRRQIAFDRDVWVIEIEDRKGRHLLDDWLARGSA